MDKSLIAEFGRDEKKSDSKKGIESKNEAVISTRVIRKRSLPKIPVLMQTEY